MTKHKSTGQRSQRSRVALPETVTAFKSAHRKVVAADGVKGRRMADAGLALVDAMDAGAVTFERLTKSEQAAAPEVWTKSRLATETGASGTLLTKYRTVGLLQRKGITPEADATDWAFICESAAAKWLSDLALDGTKDGDAVRAGIAAKRAGSQSGSGGATTGTTKGKRSAQPEGKGAGKGADAPAKVTARTVEADVMRVALWLTKHPGAVKGQSARTIIALLREAADAVEAAQAPQTSKGQEQAAKVA